MQLLKMTLKNMKLAASKIKIGGLIAYPTDTVYGLGCNPFNEKSLQRLVKLKGEREKPFPILISSTRKANEIVHLTSTAKVLINKFWPGALTLILPKKNSIHELFTFGRDSLAIRIPGDDRTRKFIELCGGYLIGTSANRTGKSPCISAQEVEDEFRDEVDIVLDGGLCNLKTSSTIVDLYSSPMKIVRKGPISNKIIINILKASKKSPEDK